MRAIKDIDTYINQYPYPIQERLEKLRLLIKNLVPEAEEAIKYGMPTFVFHGNLLHFAAYEHHIGLYPGSEALIQFKDALVNYKTGIGSIQLPHSIPLPITLIEDIIVFRKQVMIEKNQQKKRKIINAKK
ncbi:iron chaperone [Pedobacter flavus]|uniref:DUF1801 domain-containing protein n=1 Tax=Pedobacter flavus TaxID=3113906 RepID=A0ABU7GYI2_9SPHI|nr:DUF1801 domain-containing protein [Pedobacter sp. VNH31]MEE1884122.1 DUF1801 domain-containing protein [Pedobacter sp. VNH31]